MPPAIPRPQDVPIAKELTMAHQPCKTWPPKSEYNDPGKEASWFATLSKKEEPKLKRQVRGENDVPVTKVQIQEEEL